MADTDLNTLFQQAVTGYGKAFLDAESAITAQGETATQFLTTKQADTSLNTFDRFIAATLAGSIAGTGTKYTTATTAIKNKQTRASQTPLGTPAPDAIAGVFSIQGDTIADLVALHLVKELQWAQWEVMAAVIYLGYYAGASVLPAFDQFQADLKSGKRGPAGQALETNSGPYYTDLVEAMEAVRIVIENDAFKADIAKVKAADGHPDEQHEAAQIAIAQAISLLYTDPDTTQKIDQAIVDIRTELLSPVLRATQGDLSPKYVRSILAQYVLGVDDSKSHPQTDHTQSTQTDTSGKDGGTPPTTK